MKHPSLLFALLVFLGILASRFVTGSFPNITQCSEANSLSPHCIFVYPTDDFDNCSCIEVSEKEVYCTGLDCAFNKSLQANHSIYVLKSATYYLTTSPAPFSNLSNISIIGSGIQSTFINCNNRNNVGFSFERVTNVSISDLSILGCAALRNSTSRSYSDNYNLSILVAMYFYSCVNLHMDSVSVSDSPNATGVVVYNTVGVNIIENSCFSNNQVPAKITGGGGFYVELSFWDKSQDQNSTFVFDNCDFSKNSASSETASHRILCQSSQTTLGRGGGLSVFMKGNASRNNITILECQFNHNSATWGGGLLVEFHDSTFGNVVDIERCEVDSNHCPFIPTSSTEGGGVYIGHFSAANAKDYVDYSPNKVSITSCTFSNNTALHGGGLSISPAVQNVDLDQIATVLISQSDFTNNTARLGSALYISRFAMNSEGSIMSVALSNKCTFNSNSVNFLVYSRKYDESKITAYEPGLGAVYINQVPVSFSDEIIFSSNQGSALAAVGAALDFSKCSAHFMNNEGTNGAAIALLGLAWLKISDYTTMSFSGNTATVNGGAIYNRYIERENLDASNNCFIRHSNYSIEPQDWDAKLTFHANFDQSGARPSALYSSSLLPCVPNGENKSKVFCWRSMSYSDTDCTNYIHSDIGNISWNSTVTTYPGDQVHLLLEIGDDLNHNISSNQTVFSRTVQQDGKPESSSFSYVWNLTTIVEEAQNSTVQLLLDSVGERSWHIEFQVKLEECPPGFQYNKVNHTCKCNSTYSGAVVCNQNNTASLEGNRWIGKLKEEKKYLVGICPAKYCHPSTVSLPISKSELDTVVCEGHRTGVLCGSCEENYSVAVNSPTYKCVNCSNDTKLAIVKYVASVYLPLTLAFSFIILFKIRLTSAPGNAFILYCQVLASTFDLHADGEIPSYSHASQVFTQTYRALYGVFNLEFFETFFASDLCIGDLTTLEVIALDYIVAVYPLLVIILILVLYKINTLFKCRCCFRIKQLIARFRSRRRGISEALLPAFAAFFLLSYNKFSITSSFLVATQPLVLPSGSNYRDEQRVYFNGTLSSSDVTNYLVPFYLPACIVFATFVTIPPLLLLVFPIKIFEKCLIKIPILWRRYPADKVHILLDTFQGCYKNNMRFFAGLYFLFRLAVTVSYTLTNKNLTHYLIQQILCSVMIGLLLVCQPYKKENKLFNIIDPLIFLNLSILNSISFYLLATESHENTGFLHGLQSALVLIPLLYMIIYIIWYLLQPCLKRLRVKLRERKNRYQVLRGVASAITSEATSQQVDVDSESDIESEDESLLRRAELRNTYRPRSRAVVSVDGSDGEARVQTLSSTDSGLNCPASSTTNSSQSSKNTRST